MACDAAPSGESHEQGFLGCTQRSGLMAQMRRLSYSLVDDRIQFNDTSNQRPTQSSHLTQVMTRTQCRINPDAMSRPMSANTRARRARACPKSVNACTSSAERTPMAISVTRHTACMKRSADPQQGPEDNCCCIARERRRIPAEVGQYRRKEAAGSSPHCQTKKQREMVLREHGR